jgi:hypothetical protein
MVLSTGLLAVDGVIGIDAVSGVVDDADCHGFGGEVILPNCDNLPT